MPTLLVVDDEPVILQFFEHALQELEIILLRASTAAQGFDLATKHRPDVVVLDVELPDLSGLELHQRIRAFDAHIPVIVMTGRGTTATVIQAMAQGAFDYLLKPLQIEPLRDLIARAVDASRLMRFPAMLGETETHASAADVLTGRCQAMQEVYKLIGRVAPQNVTVLILGESGTGKELVARAIYHYSQRSAGPFLAINCAAIPETLLESELFGHEKGAFTGADRTRIGKFEQCSGGTILLDEIGDMTPLTQAKILRVLQDQQFERVGGHETIRSDARLIAATNRDLEKMVAANQFRSDLYYRLNVYTIRLPTLPERGDDLPLLADQFLKQFNREFKKQVTSIAPETIELFTRYHWPGNVRELQSVIKHGLLQASGPVLLPDHLPAALRPAAEAATVSAPDVAAVDLAEFIRQKLQAASTNLYAEWLAHAERQLFTLVLEHTKGNLTQAAKILGLHRTTLRSKLNALDIRTVRKKEAD